MERTLLILWLERHAAALEAALDGIGEALPAEAVRYRQWRRAVLLDTRPPPGDGDDPELWVWREAYEPHPAVKRLRDELERLRSEIEALKG